MTDYPSRNKARLRALVRNKDTSMRLAVAASNDSAAEMFLYDEIDATGFCGTSAKAFVAQLNEIDADELHLYLNSPGGDAFEGITIMNALRRHKARVVVHVDGLAASAASAIAMAGDEVVMGLGSELMIHDAWGLTVGNAEDMRDMASRLDKLSDDLADVYAERAGGSIGEWRDAMRAETWYSASEAVEAGLADRTESRRDDADEPDAKARFDLSIFAHAGRAKAPAPFMPGRTARASKPPATEPAEPTHEGGVMADATPTFAAAVAARLGVSDPDADEVTVLAALDETLAEQAGSSDEPAAEAGEDDNEVEATAMADATVLAEVTRLSTEVADLRAEKAADERREFFDAALRDGRISADPKARAAWEDAYDEAPDKTKALILAMAPGSAVPVGQIGHEGTGDGAINDNELAAAEAALFLPKGALRG